MIPVSVRRTVLLVLVASLVIPVVLMRGAGPEPLALDSAPAAKPDAPQAIARRGENRDPARAVEGEPLARDETPDPDFRVRVVAAESGVPLAGAWVFAGPRSGRVLRGRTDEAGEARFPASGEPLTLAVAAEERPPVTALGVEPRGVHVVSLERGLALTGRVLVDGAPPSEPLELHVEAARSSLRRDLPPELEQELLNVTHVIRVARLVTDDQGRFALRGLPTDWSARLNPPSTYWIEGSTPERAVDGYDQLLLPAPVEGLEVRLGRHALVTGRVVWADDGEPVEGASGHVKAVFADGRPSVGMGFMTGRARGRFEAALYPIGEPDARTPLESVEITVYTGPGWLGTTRELAASELGAGGDVGDIAVERTAPLHLVVRDETGAPVAGALAFPVQPGLEIGSATRTETAADGTAVLTAMAPDATALHVGARGFAVRRFEVGLRRGTPEAPVEVVLERTNSLEVEVRGPAGEVLPGLAVRVEHDGALFLGEDERGPTPVHGWLMGARYSGSGREEFPLDADGRLELFGLRPRIPLQLSVVDGGRTAVAVRDLVAPGPRETARCAIVADARPAHLRGVVSDSEGRPIAFAEAWLTGEGFRSRRRSTDGSGGFDFGALYDAGRPLTLEVTAGGHAGARVERLVLTPDTEPLFIVLERGLAVTVELREPDGSPAPSNWIAAAAPGHPSVGAEARDGRFVLEGLAAGAVLLTTRVGGRVYERSHETTVPELFWTLPAHGTLVVQAPSAEWPDGSEQRFARVTDTSDPGVEVVGRFRRDSQAVELALLPGTWRVEWLATRPARDGSEERTGALAAAATVEVRAGAVAHCSP